MRTKLRILLKLTGEIFGKSTEEECNSAMVHSIAQQLQTLRTTHQFGIVIGGGNFFRGNIQGKQLGISPAVGHQIGMLATMMNGLMLKDIFEQNGLRATVLCAKPNPDVGIPLSDQAITDAFAIDSIPIFVGGMGNPFLTTDTCAIIRAQQISADEVWKATNIDGIYRTNPHQDKTAPLLKQVSPQEALTWELDIMDMTAYALAAEHHVAVRVFDLFSPEALLQAAHNETFGSILAHRSKHETKNHPH